MANEERRKFWEVVQELTPAKHSMVLQGVPYALLDAIFQAHVQLDTVWQCPNCVTLNRSNEMVCDGEHETCHNCGTVVELSLRMMPAGPCPECGKPTDREPNSPCEACEIGPTATHDQLWAICRKLPTDFVPYGERPDEERGGDCSTSCKWFHELGRPSGDWGVCFNPASPRAGLLTFEHQGCPAFECEPDDDEDDDD